jgi:hypothetical protein
MPGQAGLLEAAVGGASSGATEASRGRRRSNGLYRAKESLGCPSGTRHVRWELEHCRYGAWGPIRELVWPSRHGNG